MKKIKKHKKEELKARKAAGDKKSDRLGIVYTPKEIISFIIKGSDYLLSKYFNNNLSSKQVDIIDPFVGHGNFILKILNYINKQSSKEILKYKYENNIFCNEILDYSYKEAKSNIESKYKELIGEHLDYNLIKHIDTFDIDKEDNYFNFEDIKPIDNPIKLIIGNPPYNANQGNENNDNKNKPHPLLDKEIKESYVYHSKSQLNNTLYDPYVKAIKWSTRQLEKGGIIAFVSNNSFLKSISFDGMRSCLNNDFNYIYILDLGGNLRQLRPLKQKVHNVFGIRVGVSISFFIKNQNCDDHKIFYKQWDDSIHFLKTLEKLESSSFENIEWEEINPISEVFIKKGTPRVCQDWFPGPYTDEFYRIPLSLGNKVTKASKGIFENPSDSSLFNSYSSGLKTGRDKWVYQFDKKVLKSQIKKIINNYNIQLKSLKDNNIKKNNIRKNLKYDKKFIKWSETLIKHIMGLKEVNIFDSKKIMNSLYRPFVKKKVYFDSILMEGIYRQHYYFPLGRSDLENIVICVSGLGHGQGCFSALVTNTVPNLDLIDKTQTFPYYVYDKKGNNRKENITDSCLDIFRNIYNDKNISKKSIFYYIYSILNHKVYKGRYKVELTKLLPRIPLLKEFYKLSKLGKILMKKHIKYENYKKYKNLEIEIDNKIKDEDKLYYVNKMVLKEEDDKYLTLIYNEHIKIKKIPKEVNDFMISNRSALQWVVKQYKYTVCKETGIINDPNSYAGSKYIFSLIKRIIALSLDSINIINKISEIKLENIS